MFQPNLYYLQFVNTFKPNSTLANVTSSQKFQISFCSKECKCFKNQHCALAVSVGCWCLFSLMGDWKILYFFFSKKSYAGHPGFYRFRALVSLRFFLVHSLEEPFKSSAKEVLNSNTTGFHPQNIKMSE